MSAPGPLLQEMQGQAAAVSQLSDGERLVAGSNLGRAFLDRLSGADQLRAVAESVIAVAERFGVDGLVGASEVGTRLAVAAVTHANNGLHLYRSGDQRVLIVEGAAVTGVGIARSAAPLVDAGVHEVFATVAFDARAHADVIPGVTGLAVLE